VIDLFATGVYLRKPGGNVENLADQALVPVAWAALNVGGDVGRDPSVWARQRALYAQAGVPVCPWLHCRNIADIEWLIGVGELWKSKAIGVNIEDVAGDKISLREVGGVLLDFWVNPHEAQVHLATLPWVQNGQGWHHVDFAVVALEINPDENDNSKAPLQVLADHAFAEGLKHVTYMYGTKVHTWPYDLSFSHSLYTGDDIPPLAATWRRWQDPAVVTKPRPTPPPPGGQKMLTVKQFPYTGPFRQGDRNHSTIKGLKRGMIRLGHLHQKLGTETDDFGPDLDDAMTDWWKARGGIGKFHGYGKGSWLALRQERLIEGPNAGAWAMDSLALKYVRDDMLTMCYPHVAGSLSEVPATVPHVTAGVPGNWAYDFIAPGGTKVVAVERAEITRLSGHDPSEGADQVVGIFGWSISYETAAGYRYFSTHYGTRATLAVGQIVDVGQVLGTVGHWPGDPSRSHTHLGVTSPLGTADAKKRIGQIKSAARVAA
jgi:hypothetical protein